MQVAYANDPGPVLLEIESEYPGLTWAVEDSLQHYWIVGYDEYLLPAKAGKGDQLAAEPPFLGGVDMHFWLVDQNDLMNRLEEAHQDFHQAANAMADILERHEVLFFPPLDPGILLLKVQSGHIEGWRGLGREAKVQFGSSMVEEAQTEPKLGLNCSRDFIADVSVSVEHIKGV